MKIDFILPSSNYLDTVKRDKKELAKEFEAILLKEFLKEGLKPVLENKSFQERMYYDSFIDSLSRKLAEAGGVGIAKMILKSIKDEKDR
ncbi:rod-binding protein [Thermocrinis minervae]|uniref:Rod binding protein n=1 Tax=Thermocrinis minervae TaxID=381751 RepID=A0A1M6TIQ4_9AQUI|nr:rod-binding protein [Thermocrinis minervae]SHK56789.1 Rod binding protein [Thermocrinis minervae]